jgi:hypothetical protein
MKIKSYTLKNRLYLLSASTLLVSCVPNGVHGFVPTFRIERSNISRFHDGITLFSFASEGPDIGFEGSCLMTKEEIAPIITIKKGTPKEKFINTNGLYCILVTLILNPIWALAMTITDAVCGTFPDLDPNRAFYDKTGKMWSKAWLTMTDSFPSISGDVARLKEENELGACLFVANHSSWYDILLLCTVLDPVFKFIAKGELRDVPCIGQQLVGVSNYFIKGTLIHAYIFEILFSHIYSIVIRGSIF